MESVKSVEEITKDKNSIDFLRDLLNNIGVLKWVKRNTADNLSEDLESFKRMNITLRDDSIGIMDSDNVKCLITHAIYSGEKYVVISLEQLATIIADIGPKGRLIIGKKEQPVFIEDESNNVVLKTPRVE